MTNATLERPRIATPADWLAARKALLKKEKELTHLRDTLAAERQALPWVRVEKELPLRYARGKEIPRGPLRWPLATRRLPLHVRSRLGRGLPELLDGRRRIRRLYCAHCAARCIVRRDFPRALPKIEAFKKRMGWRFSWVSSHDTSFNRDFKVTFTKEELAAGNCYNFGTATHPGEEAPGLSFFAKDESETVFHTYSTFGRGVEDILPVYPFLDRAPKGRNEAGLPFSMAWVRHHDRYADGRLADADRPYWPAFELEDSAPAKRSAAAKADSSCCHGETH